ncbi:MAG: type II secretion system protein [Paenisporosarcina sp.]
MKSERGYSFAETMLTLTVVMVIFGVLLPLSYHMIAKLNEQKVEVHLAYTSHQAAIERGKGIFIGNRIVEEVNYSWKWEGKVLCIDYTREKYTYQSCENY